MVTMPIVHLVALNRHFYSIMLCSVLSGLVVCNRAWTQVFEPHKTTLNPIKIKRKKNVCKKKMKMNMSEGTKTIMKCVSNVFDAKKQKKRGNI